MLPRLVKKITALLGSWAVIFFCYHLRSLKRAASAISNIANANSASYVTIAITRCVLINHRHHSFLALFGRSKDTSFRVRRKLPPPFWYAPKVFRPSLILYHKRGIKSSRAAPFRYAAQAWGTARSAAAPQRIGTNLSATPLKMLYPSSEEGYLNTSSERCCPPMGDLIRSP